MIVSAASAWEIATKFRLGKLNFARELVESFVPRVTAAGYLMLSISPEHTLRAGLLPGITKTHSTGCWRRRQFTKTYPCSAIRHSV